MNEFKQNNDNYGLDFFLIIGSQTNEKVAREKKNIIKNIVN